MSFAARVASGVVAAAVLATPALAQAATTVGAPALPLERRIGGSACASCVHIHGERVAADGVITRWRLGLLSAPGSATVRLRLVRRIPESGRYRFVGTSAPKEVGPGDAGRVLTFRTQLAVRAGDQIAVEQSTVGVTVLVGRQDSERFDFVTAAADGLDVPVRGDNFGQPALNAEVEPDRDGDALGDETQDRCPASSTSSTATGCPVPAPGASDPSPDAPAPGSSSATPGDPASGGGGGPSPETDDVLEAPRVLGPLRRAARRSSLRVRVACPAGRPACAGRLELRRSGRILASGRFAGPAGRVDVVVVRLRRAACRALRSTAGRVEVLVLERRAPARTQRMLAVRARCGA